MSAESMAIQAELVTRRLTEFNLTTAATEIVPRLVEHDLGAAVPIIGEVLNAEAEARHERRVTRLRRASKLPAAKTFDSFDMNRIPAALPVATSGGRFDCQVRDAIEPLPARTHAIRWTTIRHEW